MNNQRILVADDDARWKAELEASAKGSLVFVDNLSDAMAMIDRRRRWTGAILDRYLLAGDVPFSRESLVSEAGFLIGLAFAKKFPEARVCICSGDVDVTNIPKHLEHLLQSPNIHYLYKGSPDAGARAVSYVEDGRRSSGIAAEIYDCLLLELNFNGLGFSIKEVIELIRRHAHRRRGGGDEGE